MNATGCVSTLPDTVATEPVRFAFFWVPYPTTITSPTLADQLRGFLKLYPQAKWHVYEPVNRDNVYAGTQMAFGQAVETTYKLDAADVIVSLDADFLYAGFPGTTRYARDFAKRRDPDSGNMSRFYAIESTPTRESLSACWA